MTKYHGGKNQFGRELASIIFQEAQYTSKVNNMPIQGYCEPFCGMLGVYRHIPEFFKEDISLKAGDINKSVVLMWQAAQTGWEPGTKEISKAKFMQLKNDPKSTAEKGFVGHRYGFMGQYFQPFTDQPSLVSRQKASKKIVDIAEKLQLVEFTHGSYEKFSHLKGFVIYCDPPYYGQAHYYIESGQKKLKFDHHKFWDWCRQMSQHNILFISEYELPADFEVIWAKKTKTCKASRIDKLFTFENYF